MKNVNLESNSVSEISRERIDIAEKMLSILDEDGQPMYNQEWIQRNILGIIEENEKLE